jgi:hypothetical protein
MNRQLLPAGKASPAAHPPARAAILTGIRKRSRESLFATFCRIASTWPR